MESHTVIRSASAFDSLPHELLIDVMRLTTPSPHLPATSRVVTPLFCGDTAPGRLSWIHHLVFTSPVPSDLIAFEGDEHLFLSYPETRQVQSRVAWFLKTRLPHPAPESQVTAGGHFASNLAPDHPQHDPLFTQGYINWLFGSKGPMGCRPGPAASWQQRADCNLGQQLSDLFGPVDMSADFVERYSALERIQPRMHLHWTRFPDAFLFMIYFLRAGDTNMFKHTLERLLLLFPNLPNESHPFSLWAQLAMDNREEARSVFSFIIFENNPIVSFPLFLAYLAVLDWSLASLYIILECLSLDPNQLVEWLSRWTTVAWAPLRTLRQCTSAGRAVAVMEWLAAHGFTFPPQDFPFLSSYAGCFSVFYEVLVKLDVPKLAQVEDPIQFDGLGTLIAQWIIDQGDVENREQQHQLLSIAIEYGLFADEDFGRLLWAACVKGNPDRQAWVLHNAGQESVKDVLHFAIQASDEPLPDALAALFGHMVHAENVCPTQLFIAASSNLSIPIMSLVLLQLDVDLDLDLFTTAWLSKFGTDSRYQEASRPNAERIALLGKVLFRVMAGQPAFFNNKSMSAKDIACAMAVYLSHLVNTDDKLPLLDSHVDIATRMIATVQDALGVQGPLLSPSDSAFSALIPPSVLATLSDASRSLSSTRCTLDPTWARQLFDALYKLDPVFAKRSAKCAWEKDACAWVWSLYSMEELTVAASKLKPQQAIGALRLAAERGQTDWIATMLHVLPASVRHSQPFRRAIESMSRQYPVLAVNCQD